MDSLHIKIHKKIKANGVPDAMIKKAESIIDAYYKIIDECRKKYGEVKVHYNTYNGSSGKDREKPGDAQCIHHVEQIWFDVDLNPKLGTNWMYKANIPRVEIALRRQAHYHNIMTNYAEWQKPEYLVWCTKEEHKLLHNLIKEYRLLWH